MRDYIIRRLLLMILTVFLLTFIIFTAVRVIPGDVIDAMMSSPDSTLDREFLEKKLGLDAPLIVQYARWMGLAPKMDGKVHGFFQGDLGESFWRRESVIKLAAGAWPVTVELGLMAIILTQAIALPIGIFSALRQDKWGDYIGRSFAILCISLPQFWVGTLVIVLPAVFWGKMPPIMLIHFAEDPIGNLLMFLLPAIVLGLTSGGATMRLTRTMMLEVLRQDYIRTAWAKGLTERKVIIRHAVKNALIPVISLIGLQIPVLIGGTVVIENIFSLPGMGRLMFNALLHRDEELVCGLVIIFSIALVMINLFVDLAYAWLDPRVTYN
jgi:peptide/nickel transport system permease protein